MPERRLVSMPERRLDATALRDWAHSAVGHLIRHADEINGIVADGRRRYRPA